MGRSVSFAEFERRRQARPYVQTFVRCGSCGVKMPVPHCPGAEPGSVSVCHFDTCDSCLKEYPASVTAGESFTTPAPLGEVCTNPPSGVLKYPKLVEQCRLLATDLEDLVTLLNRAAGSANEKPLAFRSRLANTLEGADHKA